MAEPISLRAAGGRGQRVLILADDAWLRFRLKRELEQEGVESIAARLEQAGSAAVAAEAPFDLVLVEAGRANSGRENLAGLLRRQSPQARLVLLTDPRKAAMRPGQNGFDLVAEQGADVQELAEQIWRWLRAGQPELPAAPVEVKLEILLEAPQGTGRRRAGSAFTALLVHAFVLALALLFPLLFTESLNVQELTTTWLMAPPPPPPPPPPQTAMRAAQRVKPVFQTATGKLVAPTAIPKEVAHIIDPPGVELDTYSGGVIGGVPGGVPGGQLGGVLGGVIGGIPSVATQPPPPPTPTRPVRVGAASAHRG